MNNKFERKKIFSDALKERLIEIKNTNKDSVFARKCGIPVSSMNKYLNGSIPGVDKLVKIADANDVFIEWLATGQGPKNKGEADCSKLQEVPDDYTSSPAHAMEQLGEVIRDSREKYEKAEEIAEFKPPTAVREHIRSLVFAADLKRPANVDDIVRLLESLSKSSNKQ